jgi:hypothetical protein
VLTTYLIAWRYGSKRQLVFYLFRNQNVLTFDAQATSDCYKVGKFTDYLVTPDQVVFTTPDPVKLPLPSPDLLALHATCAQVAHLSGAREYLDRIIEEMEELGVLAQDGTSSEVLHHALMTLGSHAISV